MNESQQTVLSVGGEYVVLVPAARSLAARQGGSDVMMVLLNPRFAPWLTGGGGTEGGKVLA